MFLFRRIYLLCSVHLHKISWPSLLLGSILHYFICWIALSALGEQQLVQLPQFFYFMSVVGSTVGFGDMSPITTGGQQFVAWYQIPASIGIFGSVLAKLIATAKALIERNINGMRNFSHYNNHVIIIGWHPKGTRKLIDCILSDKRRQNGQILIGVNDDNLIHPYPDNDQVDFAKMLSFSNEEALSRIAVDQANRVIIYGETDDQTLMAALAIAPRVKPSCHIVAYFNDEQNAALLDKHCPNIESGSNRSAELLARSMQDPGSSRVISHLLNPQTGATQFSFRIPENVDSCTVGQLWQQMKNDNNATLIAISTMMSGDDVELNPPAERQLTSGHFIHYIASERILASEVNWHFTD
ncbi:potassium channel family protein [Shewanella surugensis]|uniref:Ion channel n=1 Tax=Shewanella surugensis TaxID=212020 RepID=A0ABT0L9S5_9GAMM|nr:potassium channel family protein [Shewanella surugensis]MCL1124472.1 ion channel [Shewanella surugensis]